MRKTKKTSFVFILTTIVLLILFVDLSPQQTAEELFEKALYIEEAQGDLQKAIELYEQILKQFPENRENAAKAQLHIGLCYEKLGLQEAPKAYQKVLDDFPEQREAVKIAQEKLSVFLKAKAAMQKTGKEFNIRKVWDKALDSYFMGAPSPDGNYLTYSTEQDFLSLGVRDLVKGENRLLTHNKSWLDAEYCYNSIFSPDSSQIAYICQVVKDRVTHLRTINIDGTSSRILRDGKDGLDYIPFGWTSDGKQILTTFFGRENICGIAFISTLDGSVKDKKTLSLKVPWGGKMSLSPDGKYIAGTYLPSEESANRDIFLLSIDGDRETKLVEHPADDVLIGWSPDGRQVLFTSDRTGSIGIWVVNVSDGKAKGMPEFVRGNVGNIQPLGMTRDGKLYYGISTGSTDVFVAPIDPATGKVTGQPEKAFRKYETFNSTPDWSPDGKSLYFLRRNGDRRILHYDLETGEEKVLFDSPAHTLYLSLSPDGQHLVFYADDTVMLLPTSGGEPRKLIQEKDIRTLAWFRDGRFLLYGKRQDPKSEVVNVWRIPVEGGDSQKLELSMSHLMHMRFHPDGRHIAFTASVQPEKRELWVMKNFLPEK